MSIKQSTLPVGKQTISDLCIACIDSISNRIKSGESLESEDLVHQSRVLTKQLRAAWKLVSGIAPKATVRQRHAALKEFSKTFAGSRDETVLKQLCSDLADHLSAPQSQVLRRLEKSIQIQVVKPLITSSDVLQPLEEERNAWASLNWGRSKKILKPLENQFLNSVEKAHQRTKMARESSDPEEWHNWRKVLKTVRYQSEFLADLEQRSKTEFEKGIKDLGSMLGHRNDLDNLQIYAKSLKTLSMEDQNLIDSVLEIEIKKIMRMCRKSAARLFPESE